VGSAVASAFFGSCGVPIRGIKERQDPMAIQVFISLAVFASSWVVLAFGGVTFRFQYQGVISACLWMTSNVFGIFIQNTIGYPVGQGISSTTSIIISFLWGLIVIYPIKDLPLSVLGLVFVGAGIAGITMSSSDLLDKFFNEDFSYSENEKINEMRKRVYLKPETSRAQTIIGVTCSLLQGLTQGTTLVPLFFLDPSDQTEFIVSFGIGVLIITPIFTIFYIFILYRCFEESLDMNFKLLVFPGIFSGLLWNIGNYGCIFSSIFLGLSCGFPLSQTYITIIGLWKIIFKEIKGLKSIGLFGFSSIILIGGAALVGSYAVKK